MLSSTAYMARKQRDRGRQSHPKGPFDTVDDELKIELRKAMDAKGFDQKDLAHQIPCSPASITNMFKPGTRQIRFKQRLFEVLGLPGGSAGAAAKRRQLERVALSLDEDDVGALLNVAISFAKKNKS